MSKISITPNATGTGVFTISSPATNTDRSLTLPDEAGSIVVNTATGIDVTGTVTADGLTVDGYGTFSRPDNENLFLADTANTSRSSFQVSATVNYFNANIDSASHGNFVWRSSNAYTERMRIDSSGFIDMGPQSLSGVGRLNVSPNPSNNYLAQWWNTAGVTIGHIVVSGGGTATTYATSSDYRLKTDAQPMVGASDRVLALKPVNFEWISSGDRVDGFLAHEAQEVVPECVTGTKDAMRDEEYEVTAAVLDADGAVVTEAVMGTRSVPDMQGIDQSKLVPLLTAALQEALNKIAAMEIRLAALEAV